MQDQGPLQKPLYGVRGVGAPDNTPGIRCSAAGWTDHRGHLWLFGGKGYGATFNTEGFLNDLWRYIPEDDEWTWMGVIAPSAVYGLKNEGSIDNSPGIGIEGFACWSDKKGHLWLFGGTGSPTGRSDRVTFNHLWRFVI